MNRLMSLKIEKTDKANEVKLEFTVEAEKFENGIKTVFNRNAKYFNIPGFRKGKAPYQIVEKTYGVEIFYEDAFNEIVPEIYDEELIAKKKSCVTRVGMAHHLLCSRSADGSVNPQGHFYVQDSKGVALSCSCVVDGNGGMFLVIKA